MGLARKGEGYLALTAAQRLGFVTRGDSAYRELRSHGQHNVWLCHMGRAVQDGSFGEFQNKVLAMDMAWVGLSVPKLFFPAKSIWPYPEPIVIKEETVCFVLASITTPSTGLKNAGRRMRA